MLTKGKGWERDECLLRSLFFFVLSCPLCFSWETQWSNVGKLIPSVSSWQAGAGEVIPLGTQGEECQGEYEYR